MTRPSIWIASFSMLLFSCQTGAQSTPTAPASSARIYTGHQAAHHMQLPDGSLRTMPDGTPIQLAGGTFTITLQDDGQVQVDRKLDDGRQFAYVGQCNLLGTGAWRCTANDGVGTPLVFELVLNEEGTGQYRSMGYDPPFDLARKGED